MSNFHGSGRRSFHYGHGSPRAHPTTISECLGDDSAQLSQAPLVVRQAGSRPSEAFCRRRARGAAATRSPGMTHGSRPLASHRFMTELCNLETRSSQKMYLFNYIREQVVELCLHHDVCLQRVIKRMRALDVEQPLQLACCSGRHSGPGHWDQAPSERYRFYALLVEFWAVTSDEGAASAAVRCIHVFQICSC